MLSSTIRTIVTGKASVGLATLALLGGGAALASPGDVTDTPDADDAQRVTAVDDAQPEVDRADQARERTRDIDAFCDEQPQASFCRGPSFGDEATGDDSGTEGIEDELEEPEGNAWALGRQDADQQDRVEDFCEAKTQRAEEANTTDEGIPPFCTTDDGPVPPNQHGRMNADAARDADRSIGRPAWAGRDGDRDRSGDDSAEVEPSGQPTETDRPERAGRPDAPPGPPDHANAGGRGNS